MSTIQKSLRIPEETIKEIEYLARASKKDFTTVANELIEEAIRVHRCPGIVFTEGVSGKRARIAGTGIEVWEVVATYRSVGEDFERLSKSYHWLTVQQLKSALGYYRVYTAEIDAIIADNEALTPEEIRKRYPFLAAG
ncbi:MAG: hypothetical protein A2X93_07435 [Deltaproteobacteria bacterium GWC2_56_8]|nr:MAG: hypothetical protein A2X99_02250 [Deltaproteobacteria bacterium GWB2_55_19]OGP35246.1 MAG: hypothetical protein A2X93_07435 [Deltaproteobacteria bacterium GWC2_56_8]